MARWFVFPGMAVALLACSTTTGSSGNNCDNVCPQGCNLTDQCACVAQAPNISYTLIAPCMTNGDCCTGTCDLSQSIDGGPGICSSVAAGGTTGTTGGNTTGGQANAGICFTDGGMCGAPAPFGQVCTQTSDCKSAEFYCGMPSQRCQPKCTACTCWCSGDETCNASSGICEAPSSTTGTTSGSTTGATGHSAATSSGVTTATASSTDGTTGGVTGGASTTGSGSTSAATSTASAGTTASGTSAAAGGTTSRVTTAVAGATTGGSTSAAGTTAGTTSGTTGGTGGTTGGTTSGTTLYAGGCSPRNYFNTEFAECSDDGTCGCGQVCATDPSQLLSFLGGDGQYCETRCESSADCPDPTAFCSGGTCTINDCSGGPVYVPCGVASPGASDGYCLPYDDQGFELDLCTINGSVQVSGTCQSISFADQPNANCGSGLVCVLPDAAAKAGSCYTACDPSNGEGICPGLESCESLDATVTDIGYCQ